VAEGWTVAYLSPDMDDLARARWDAIRKSLHKGRTLADLRTHCPVVEEQTVPALAKAATGRQHRVIAGLKAIVDARIPEDEGAVPDDLAAVVTLRPEELPELVHLLPGSALLADLVGVAEPA
jgi:hypothetical protein